MVLLLSWMARTVSWVFLLLVQRLVGEIVVGINRSSLLRLARGAWWVEVRVEVQGFPVDWE